MKTDAAIRRVLELIEIPGHSGHEDLVAKYLTKALVKAGVSAKSISHDTANRRSPAGGKIGNLIVKLPGTIKGPRRLLMAHMDTVPLAVGCQPVRKGNIVRPKKKTTALGGDNRAGCATVLSAVCELLEQKIDHPPLTLLFTVQEEIGLRGARFLTASKLGKPELCFNWDGRDPAGLVIGAVGANYLSIDVTGIASHAGVHPEDGINAAVVASVALADLQQNGWHGLIEKGKQTGTSNLGVIEGGAATNVVMPECTLQAEARSHQRKFRDRITAEFEKAFAKAVKSVKTADGRTGQCTITEDARYEAFRIKPSNACVQLAMKAVQLVNLEPHTMIGNGGLDANWLTAHGFPTVTMGCGQHNIHTVDEFMDLDEYLKACEVALRLASAA